MALKEHPVLCIAVKLSASNFFQLFCLGGCAGQFCVSAVLGLPPCELRNTGKGLVLDLCFR
eukprot:scaffold277719_cov18-Tisochrysis_lutea.AAC.2